MHLHVAESELEVHSPFPKCMASDSVTADCALILCFESDEVIDQAVSPVTCQTCMGCFLKSDSDALIHTVLASPDFWRPVCGLYTTPDGLPTQGLVITVMSVYACCPVQRVCYCFIVFFQYVVASDPLCCSMLIPSNH